jgi:peptidoglycan/LPS O-acetylase OafA/YrhL
MLLLGQDLGATEPACREWVYVWMRSYVTWANARDRELHYRPDLDGLRGIAILAVVGFHAFPTYVPGGFVGVDVFFVLSGYLISTIILRQLRRSKFEVADFYIRRVRRLFPALAVVLAACLLFGWFALLPDELKALGKHIGAAAAFILNFSVWREGGYFDPAAGLNPVLHLWSLGIEEQFYLVWPWALLLLWRRPRTLVVAIGALVAASFALNIVFAHTDPRGDFFLPVTRFWELGLGCWLAAAEGAQWRARLPPTLAGMGMVLICGAALLFHERMVFPGWAATIPVAGAMCIICARPDDRLREHALAAAPLVFVGAISYPLYLWHWPLLSFATILGSGTVPTAVRAALVLLSFVLSYLVFRFVELPIRTRSPLRAGGMLAAGLGTLGVAGLIVYSASGVRSRFGHDVRSLQTASRINHYCLQVFPGREDFNYCKSTGDGSPEIVFLGDSRAQAVYDAMVSLSHGRYPMMLLARGGCPALLNTRSGETERHEVSCNQTWSDIVRSVATLRARLVVVVGSGSELIPAPGTGGSDLEFKDGLGDLVGTLQETSQVIYVRETPAFETGPACFLRRVKVPWGSCAPVVPRAAVERRMAAYNRAVDEVQARLPGLTVLDSIGALCGTKYCAQKLRSGEILYRDRLHLTAAGARHLDTSSGLTVMIDRHMQTVWY